MALSGMHIACCYVGGPSYAKGESSPIPLVRAPVWSETQSSAGTTTNIAPAHTTLGSAVFEVRASADSYIAIGANPNATSGPRLFVPAGEFRQVFCVSGDKLAWIAA